MAREDINLELENLLKLMKIEKDEDLFEYKTKMLGTSLKERVNQGICWYPVKLEKTQFDAGERLIVKISRSKDNKHSHLFQSGKLISLFSTANGNTEGSETVNGVVNQVKDYEMLISLNSDDFPDWLDDGKLGVQLLFDENSYKEMEIAIKYLITTKDERINYLKNVLLGTVEAQFTESFEIKNPYLNQSQNQALNLVQNALDVAIIHGPPGTGKTTTLIQTILQTLKFETQVLVCAPSNAAIDLIVEKLSEQGVNVLRIGHPARVTQQVLSTTLDARITQHLSYKDLKTIRKQSEEYRKLALKYKRNFGPEEREQRKLLLQEARKLNDEAKRLIYYITDDIIAKTRVIATTMVSASNYNINGLRFKTVFIDEAAQGLEAATWIPILKAERVIFAGDHCQLPPTIKSFNAAKQGLEKTLFEKAIQRNKADVMLNEQYRMNSKIMEFSNRYFYNNNLIANIYVANWKIFENDLPVEFIDTAGCGFFEQVDEETHSTYNLEEVELLKKHITQYIDELEHNGIFDDVTDIGIVSPYKAQVKLLQEAIFENSELTDNAKSKIAVNTIDSFQGQERDIVYISLVRSNEKGEIGFLSDTRRMNVAMTRARKKLVIIGDSSTITSHKFYDKFFDYINEIEAYKSGFEYVY